MENKYFEYVVRQRNILIFGDESLEKFNNIFDKFNNYIYQELTPHNIENLSSSINNYHIDLIITTSLYKKDELFEILKRVKEGRKIHILICCYPDILSFHENIINLSDAIFTQNISENDLKYKLYNALNDFSEITNPIIDIEEQNKKIVKRERYRDAFDTEVMFICEELRAISKIIDSGDLSSDVFDRLEQNVSKVSYIVNNHLMSSKLIQKLINSFDIYLQKFDLENIDISAVDGFEQLSRFVEDLATFLDKYFITRDIDDIYIVEDSLKNSFEYIQLVFEGKQDSTEDNDGSELEFL